jgi:hypothetical protein
MPVIETKGLCSLVNKFSFIWFKSVKLTIKGQKFSLIRQKSKLKPWASRSITQYFQLIKHISQTQYVFKISNLVEMSRYKVKDFNSVNWAWLCNIMSMLYIFAYSMSLPDRTLWSWADAGSVCCCRDFHNEHQSCTSCQLEVHRMCAHSPIRAWLPEIKTTVTHNWNSGWSPLLNALLL